MEKTYTITLTREQYIVVKQAVLADQAKAFMDGDNLAYEVLQGAYQAIIESVKEER